MENSVKQPLVSVCVPVKNGAPFLSEALASIRSQTYRNLEILISDNCSTDSTSQICEDYLHEDERARYFRQPLPLSAADNFSYLTNIAEGKFLLFCAHDDLRNNNYVEVLVETLEANPDAVLAYGETYSFSADADQAEPVNFRFESSSKSRYPRVAKTAFRRCFHIYGLWRTEILRQIPSRHCLYGPDMQVLLAASALGRFVRDDRAQFRYRRSIKTYRERAQYELNETRVSPAFVLAGIRASFLTLRDIGGFPVAMVGTAAFLAREFWIRFLIGNKVRMGRLATALARQTMSRVIRL